MLPRNPGEEPQILSTLGNQEHAGYRSAWIDTDKDSPQAWQGGKNMELNQRSRWDQAGLVEDGGDQAILVEEGEDKAILVVSGWRAPAITLLLFKITWPKI